MVGSLPGRTQGLGLVTEPLLAELGIDRVSYATLNLWATLLGSAGALGVGYAVDRLGSRVVLSTVLLSLGAVVCLMSRADSLHRARGVDHPDARTRAERAFGRLAGDRRPLVRQADRQGDGDLQRGDQRRLHDRVPAGWLHRPGVGLAAAWLAIGVALVARARAAGGTGRPTQSGVSGLAAGQRRRRLGRGHGLSATGHRSWPAIRGRPRWRCRPSGCLPWARRSTAWWLQASACSTSRSSQSAASGRTSTTRRSPSRR